MNSCNDAMMQISYRLGSDIFTKYQQIFGFGQRTGIDLPGEARTDSLIYTADNMGPVDLATNAFGQNFNTTMIQLATAYCSLVNGGSLYQPHVVKRITDESGNTISEVTPTLLRETVSKSTRDALKQYMYSTVTGGTAVTAKVDGYSMGGKTGTAQKAGRDGVNYLVSFIGFAPVEDPQLVIYCVVDEPNVAEQFHSTYAQNIVREILEEVLPYMNIYRDEDTTGIHEGWGIKGEDEGDVGDVTAADVANSTADESLVIPTNEWTHIAVTYDADAKTVIIYINGKNMLETTLDCGVVNWGQTMTDEGNGFWIGHSYNRDRWLEGNISEVRIWNKVLTSAEINAKDHFYQVEPDADGLVSYWKFDEGAGTAIHDYSGNENNATAVESLTWTAVELPAK